MSKNLVENGDFENFAVEHPTWGLESEKQKFETEGVHGGKRCFKMSLKQGESYASRDYKKEIPVIGGKSYELTYWIKSKVRSSFIRVKFVTQDGRTLNKPEEGATDPSLCKGTGEWEKIVYRFLVSEGMKAVVLSPRVVTTPGEALFDDIVLQGVD